MPDVFLTVQSRLSQLGIRSPEDISLVCGDYTPSFDWVYPQPSHIEVESKLAVRKTVNRVLSWVNNVARCKEDRRQSFIKASFIEGETIGPVPRMGSQRGDLKKDSKL
jgi:DNA-binding LacI/PurR family transcriptional regulator